MDVGDLFVYEQKLKSYINIEAMSGTIHHDPIKFSADDDLRELSRIVGQGQLVISTMLSIMLFYRVMYARPVPPIMWTIMINCAIGVCLAYTYALYMYGRW